MFLQVLIVLLAAKALGRVLRVFSQPPVIGEMAAGFVLGPIVFGWIAPEWQLQLFGPGRLGELKGLGQLGLVLFMFLMGAELQLDGQAGRRHLRASGTIAGFGLLLPMLLGLAIAGPLHAAMAPPGIAYGPFVLFVATALSVTALPVMARILKERDLAHSEPGRLALSAAALTDGVAWLLLAGIVAAARPTGGGGLVLALVLLLAFCGLVFGVVRPLVARWLARGAVTAAGLGVLLIGALACAWVTELLEVHAAFGAFLFGLSLPRDRKLAAALVERVEPVVLLVLMPCFFVLAGLGTTARAFAGTGPFVVGLVLCAAIVGKVVAGVVGARLAGESWRASLVVGALMNTRGVTEIIFLKVGLDVGLIGPELFTALFITALVTTLMTSPALALLSRGALKPLHA